MLNASEKQILRNLVRGRVVGFTGTRIHPFKAPDEGEHLLEVLDLLGGAHGFVTGGCIGADELIGETLVRTFPRRLHTVIVPADRSRVAAWWRRYEDDVDLYGRGLQVQEMPPMSTYAMRNQAIVNASRVLIGFPWAGEFHRTSTRSGSWQTIRMARRAGRPVLIWPVAQPGGWVSLDGGPFRSPIEGKTP